MNLSSDIKPISYLKSKTAEVINEANENKRAIIITQNGEAKVVIQDINPSDRLALIGQTRVFTPCIKQKKQEADFQGSRTEMASCADPELWPGYYSVKLSAFYGQNGNRTQDLEGNGWFLYLPWWFIIVSVVVLAFVGYHIWKTINYIRSKQGKTKLKKRK